MAECTRPFLDTALGRPLRDREESLLKKALPGLATRAKTLVDLATSACFYFRERPLRLDEKAQDLLNGETVAIIGRIVTVLDNLDPWTEDALHDAVSGFADEEGLKLGKVAQPLRAALTGGTISPSLFEVMAVLGREESLARLRDQIG